MLEQVKKLLPFKRERAGKAGGELEPVHPLARMEREFQRMLDRFGFGSLLSAPLHSEEGWDPWFGDFSSSFFLPKLDLADRRKFFEVTVELPGMDAEDVELDIEDNTLRIRGEKRFEEVTEEEGFYRTERSFGAFERRVPLPAEVDASRAEARFKKGVLRVRLPKARPEARAEKIRIRTS